MSKQTKYLGLVGLILILVGNLLSTVVSLAGFLSLVGWILTLIAYLKAADEYGEPAIKSYAIKTAVFAVIATLALIVGGGAVALALLGGLSGTTGDAFASFGGMVILVLLVGWVFAVIASWFWYKANVYMAQKTGVGLFKTGGLLMFVGTLLTIILIGGLISLVGHVLLIVAFFSVSEKGAEPSSS